MSRENVGKFFELVKTEEKLARKVVELNEDLRVGKISDEENIIEDQILPLAKDYGLAFTAEEFLEYSREQVNSGELSEEMLEAVTGGTFSPRIAAVIGLGITATSFLPSLFGSFAEPDDRVTAPVESSYSQTYDQGAEKVDDDEEEYAEDIFASPLEKAGDSLGGGTYKANYMPGLFSNGPALRRGDNKTSVGNSQSSLDKVEDALQDTVKNMSEFEKFKQTPAAKVEDALQDTVKNVAGAAKTAVDTVAEGVKNVAKVFTDGEARERTDEDIGSASRTVKEAITDAEEAIVKVFDVIDGVEDDDVRERLTKEEAAVPEGQKENKATTPAVEKTAEQAYTYKTVSRNSFTKWGTIVDGVYEQIAVEGFDENKLSDDDREVLKGDLKYVNDAIQTEDNGDLYIKKKVGKYAEQGKLQAIRSLCDKLGIKKDQAIEIVEVAPAAVKVEEEKKDETAETPAAPEVAAETPAAPEVVAETPAAEAETTKRYEAANHELLWEKIVETVAKQTNDEKFNVNELSEEDKAALMDDLKHIHDNTTKNSKDQYFITGTRKAGNYNNGWINDSAKSDTLKKLNDLYETLLKESVTEALAIEDAMPAAEEEKKEEVEAKKDENAATPAVGEVVKEKEDEMEAEEVQESWKKKEPLNQGDTISYKDRVEHVVKGIDNYDKLDDESKANVMEEVQELKRKIKGAGSNIRIGTTQKIQVGNNDEEKAALRKIQDFYKLHNNSSK